MAQHKRYLLSAALLPTASATTHAQTGASAPASQPEPKVTTPGGPTWSIADVGIALLIGLVAGYLVGVWRGLSKARAGLA